MTIERYAYRWPHADLAADPAWTLAGGGLRVRALPESAAELARDSRWPGFFPSPLALVTTMDGQSALLEKVVGASIVNRFPYTLALSFCREPLSERHHVRRRFIDALEQSGEAAVQFVAPGPGLDSAMAAILDLPEERSDARLAAAGLATRPARTIGAPVLGAAYMVYECRLVAPGRDFEGAPINDRPFADVGSHRVLFLEITCIQLRRDIAAGRAQIHWRGLPQWTAQARPEPAKAAASAGQAYVKGYTPHYAFPSAGTIAFEADGTDGDMAYKELPPLPADQVEIDNDRARWPCFFPSSVGMITTWAPNGAANVMPCGSTTMVSRQPLVLAPCVSYAAINARYAPRRTLPDIRAAGRFGCGVPFIDDHVVAAIRYSGNVSIAADGDKVRNSGLTALPGWGAPVLAELPVHFDCKVTGEIRLGTHVMFLGEVERILVRPDVSPDNPLTWIPWADPRPVA